MRKPPIWCRIEAPYRRVFLCLLWHSFLFTCFHLCPPLLVLDSLPHLDDHLLQQLLALFLRLGIDRINLSFALGVGGQIAALVEMIVQLVDPAGAGFAHLALVRGKQWPYKRFSSLAEANPNLRVWFRCFAMSDLTTHHTENFAIDGEAFEG